MMHRIAHWFGWNTGVPYAWWDGDRLMMGFFCNGCGSLRGIHETPNSMRRRKVKA
jgi:hypothetical protein